MRADARSAAGRACLGGSHIGHKVRDRQKHPEKQGDAEQPAQDGQDDDNEKTTFAQPVYRGNGISPRLEPAKYRFHPKIT